MAFQRPGSARWYFVGRTERGPRQLPCGTRNARLAKEIERLWNRLAERHRPWDVLARMKPAALFDRYERLMGSPEQRLQRIRAELDDRPLAPLVEEYLVQRARQKPEDTVSHQKAHLQAIVPWRASQATPAALGRELAKYPGKQNTVRKVHSSWSTFFRWAAEVYELWPENPMARVARPPLVRPPIRFLELDQVRRVVDHQPTPERRALVALLYGSGIELSVALRLTRRDLDPDAREARAAGTKTHRRDRIAIINDWAWPVLWEHARSCLPDVPLFLPGKPAETGRFTASQWHRRSLRALGLPPVPLHNARHHWAVLALRDAALTPRQVADQLGHGSVKLVVDTYGAFIPRREDRARARKAIARATRRVAR